jgi:hypothetical protein
MGVAAVAVPNAYFAQYRLTALRGGNASPVAHPTKVQTTQQTVIRTPRRPIPWALLTQAILPVLVLGSVGWWSFSYYQAQNEKLTPPMPKITVVGMAANAVTISDWKLDLIQLTGTVRFTGQTGVELHYKITDQGVVQGTGVIDPPAGDTLIITHDPMAVKIILPSRPTPSTQVEIEAIGG